MRKRKEWLLAALLAVSLAGCSPDTGGASGPKAIAFPVKTLQGARVDPAALPGKVVILDFWATWCGPCVLSIPALQHLHEKYGAQGLVVLGVSMEDQVRVAPFVHDTKMTYLVAADSQTRDGFENYKIESLPTTVVIDKKGNVRATEVGFDPDGTEAKLESLIRRLLAEK